MNIELQQLMPFLAEFARLNSGQQRIFLHCLERSPHITLYSSDIRDLAADLSLSPRTVQRALFVIRRMPKLAKCLTIVRYDHKEELKYAYQEMQDASSTCADLQ